MASLRSASSQYSGLSARHIVAQQLKSAQPRHFKAPRLSICKVTCSGFSTQHGGAGMLGGGARDANNAVGDFGARDPTAGEIETGFASKQTSHYDTDHVLKIPEEVGQKFFSLKNKECTKERASVLLDESRVVTLQKQVSDWKVVNVEGMDCLRLTLKMKDSESAAEFFSRVSQVANEQDHHPEFNHVDTDVTFDLWTHSSGGLTENDFILAAKIDELPKEDLLPPKVKKQRFWA